MTKLEFRKHTAPLTLRPKIEGATALYPCKFYELFSACG